NINQIRPDGTRPFPTLSSSSPVLPGAKLGNILENSSAANSSYNALWITANKRLSSGFQFNASYTFSKSIDYNSQNSQGVVVQDSYNVRGDRGLSDYDARHRFVINWIYELPFKGNRLVRAGSCQASSSRRAAILSTSSPTSVPSPGRRRSGRIWLARSASSAKPALTCGSVTQSATRALPVPALRVRSSRYQCQAAVFSTSAIWAAMSSSGHASTTWTSRSSRTQRSPRACASSSGLKSSTSSTMRTWGSPGASPPSAARPSGLS